MTSFYEFGLQDFGAISMYTFQPSVYSNPGI